MLNFTSDNCAGAHQEVLDALVRASVGQEVSYGADSYTTRLGDLVRDLFGPAATVYPVFNGTGANVVALQAMQPLWGATICSAGAHINTDEGGAPERVAGLKLVPAPSRDGKLTPDAIESVATFVGNEHHAQPTTVSLTQSTEVGTVYTQSELAALVDFSHARGMHVHMDGARLANAAAALDVPLRALTTDIGVDVVSFGGTKNGLLFGELVIVLNPGFDDGMRYVRKFNMQLASKMRFISAQFIALLEGDLWLRSASRANSMAARLRSRLEELATVDFTRPTQVNAVFATIPPEVERDLRSVARIQTWTPSTNEVRWMCSHDTTESEVEAFARAVRKAFDAERRDVAS
jgi:threonine aldolase